MIHVVLPPRDRPASCPFTQRTASLTKILGRIDEGFALHQDDEKFEARTGDLVFYTWPDVKELILDTIPVECGVGYEFRPWGPWRVYESETWRHYCFGKYNPPVIHRQNSWVIPWAFDMDEWPAGTGEGGYVSYLGRLARDKGIGALIELARRLPTVPFKIASADVPSLLADAPTNVEFVGPIHGNARAKFLGDAVVHVCPTEYVEPLGGSAIEAQLCGTPVVASNYGGFVETISAGVSGMLCKSVMQMEAAIVQYLDEYARSQRPSVRAWAATKFSLEAVAPRWRSALFEMRALR